MNEIKRFVRYTIPGIVFLFELLTALWISNDFKIPPEIETIGSIKSVGWAISAFLTSGALGYLMSILYFFAREACIFPKVLFFNHLPVIQSVKDEIPGKVIDKIIKNRIDAWIIVNYLWYTKTVKDNKEFWPLEKHDGIVDRLCDILHGLGGTFIGSLIAFGVWIYVMYWVKWDHKHEYAPYIFITFVVILFATACNYLSLKKKIENLVNMAILSTRKTRLGKVIIDYVDLTTN